MINHKKLISMAKKWQKLASLRTRRISLPRVFNDLDTEKSNQSIANKGNFFVYTSDKKRFMIPLVYLTNDIIRGLLKMAEEEFGLPTDGPITLPCDANFVEYIISMVQRRVSKDMENALLVSMSTSQCLVYSVPQEQIINHQLLVGGF
ncbi:hypothetical protein IFM89_030308 [Coptis chinensis]|uniref:Small auxin up regulated protein n=1 Tax=Coptis chinensis TaxID=261450 RepID=A0A835IR89_9MAGN|nr:hypothetical protein IFM89_025972 [Coptis chinensis]KAF9622266.1 hypothetical protein IFM89_030308 [Coptis chinensis]